MGRSPSRDAEESEAFAASYAASEHFKLSRKGPRKMALALLDEPQFHLGLVNGHGVAPSTVQSVLSKWLTAGLIVECPRPAKYEYVRRNARWFTPTPRGREVFTHALSGRNEQSRAANANSALKPMPSP